MEWRTGQHDLVTVRFSNRVTKSNRMKTILTKNFSKCRAPPTAQPKQTNRHCWASSDVFLSPKQLSFSTFEHRMPLRVVAVPRPFWSEVVFHTRAQPKPSGHLERGFVKVSLGSIQTTFSILSHILISSSQRRLEKANPNPNPKHMIGLGLG